MRIVILPAVLLAVAACSTAPSATAPANLSGIVTQAAAICKQAAPTLQAAALVPVPQVQVVSSAVGAFCAPLLAGSVPATLDSNSANWLTANLNGLIAQLGQRAIAL